MPGDFFFWKVTLFCLPKIHFLKNDLLFFRAYVNARVYLNLCQIPCLAIKSECFVWSRYFLGCLSFEMLNFIFFTWGISELKRKYLLKNRKMKSITLLGFMRCLKSFKEVLDFNENLFYSSSCKTNGIHNAADIWNEENMV